MATAAALLWLESREPNGGDISATMKCSRHLALSLETRHG